MGVEPDDVACAWPTGTSALGQELAADPLTAGPRVEALVDDLLADAPVAALRKAWGALGLGIDLQQPAEPPPPLRERVQSRRDRRMAKKLDPRIGDWLSELDQLAAQAADIGLTGQAPAELARALVEGDTPTELDRHVAAVAAAATPDARRELAQLSLLATAHVAAAAAALPAESEAWPEERLALWTDAGRLWIGTPGSDVFEAPYWAVLDPGGDDLYLGDGDARPLSVVVDLAGHDRHGGAPAAIAGVALLADLAGDDDYRGGTAALGGAISGCGLLWDSGGDDTYRGGAWSLGAALDGVGLLLDGDGDDGYRGIAPTQGAGGPGAQGWLLDRTGDDDYRALPGGPGAGAQGHGNGVDARLPGGTGLLADGAGDDHYLAGRRAQGHGVRWGLGLAIDRGGNDHWTADDWSQAAAAESGLGLLADGAGSDRYVCTRDGQARAHDGAIALLLDRRGNDTFSGLGALQARATANGIALLIDDDGDDSYHAVEPGRRWGSAEPLRGRASVALLLDVRGKDTFGPGDTMGDGGASSPGRHGLALDLPAGPAPLPGPAKYAALIQPPAADELDGVVDQALRWPDAPQDAAVAVAQLRLAGPSSYPALRRRLDPRDPVALAGLARIIDALVAGDGGGREKLAALIADDLEQAGADDEVLLVWWARAAGPARDPGPALARLDADLGSVRAAAASVLEDTCGESVATALLARLAAEPDPAARAMVARSLGGCPGEPIVGPLAGALADPDLSVRDNAIRSLVSLARAGQRGAVLAAVRPAVADGQLPALEVLVHVPDSRSQATLEELLDHPRPGTRARAALALGAIRSGSARKALLGRESVEGDPYVRWCLDRALRAPGHGAAEALPLD